MPYFLECWTVWGCGNSNDSSNYASRTVAFFRRTGRCSANMAGCCKSRAGDTCIVGKAYSRHRSEYSSVGRGYQTSSNYSAVLGNYWTATHDNSAVAASGRSEVCSANVRWCRKTNIQDTGVLNMAYFIPGMAYLPHRSEYSTDTR